MVRKRDVLETPLYCSGICLFLLQEFRAVEGNGNEDDQAFDEELSIGVADADEGEDVGDRLEEESADYNAMDRTNAAAEGDAADNASCDGIAFHALSVLGFDRSRIDAEDGGAKAIKDTSHQEDAHRGPEDVDTANGSRFGVAADGEHILTEFRFVPNKPHHRDKNHGIDNHDGEACDASANTTGEVFDDIVIRHAGISVIGEKNHATEDHQLVSKGRNERVHFEFGGKEASQAREESTGNRREQEAEDNAKPKRNRREVEGSSCKGDFGDAAGGAEHDG